MILRPPEKAAFLSAFGGTCCEFTTDRLPLITLFVGIKENLIFERIRQNRSRYIEGRIKQNPALFTFWSRRILCNKQYFRFWFHRETWHFSIVR